MGGYGGVSRLVMQGVPKGTTSELSYWTKVNGLRANIPLTLPVTVANTGARSAYLKAVSFRGKTCSLLCFS